MKLPSTSTFRVKQWMCTTICGNTASFVIKGLMKIKKLQSFNAQSPKMIKHFKNLAANGARFLKCVWPFWGSALKGLITFESCLLSKLQQKIWDISN